MQPLASQPGWGIGRLSNGSFVFPSHIKNFCHLAISDPFRLLKLEISIDKENSAYIRAISQLGTVDPQYFQLLDGAVWSTACDVLWHWTE